MTSESSLRRADSVGPPGASLWLGKTRPEAVRGREALSLALCSVDKHPQRNSTSQVWFALEALCQAGSCYLGRLQNLICNP